MNSSTFGLNASDAFARVVTTMIIVTAATFVALTPRMSHALTLTYTISATGVPSAPATECRSGIQLTDCTVGFSNVNPQFTPASLPILGAWKEIGLVANGTDGPVHAASGATAGFGVLFGSSLLTAYAASDGQRTVRDEVPNADGSVTIFQASAYAYGVVSVGLAERIIASIPPELDGLPINVTIRLPVSALGNGSSYGEVFVWAGATGTTGGGVTHSDHLLFGNKDSYSDLPYSESSTLQLTFPLRPAGDSTRTVTIPFQLSASFYSASLVLGGPGLIDSRSSIRFEITSAEGVTFRSESGSLDALLTNDSVTPVLTGLGPAKAWIGLANSDAVGLRLDVVAEVFLDAIKIGEGQLTNVSSGSNGFNNARLHSIPVALVGDPQALKQGAELWTRLSARRTCFGGGHNSGRLRLWYDDLPIDAGANRNAGSRFRAVIDGEAVDYYLRSSSALDPEPGVSRKFVDVTLDSKTSCPTRPFKTFGTWSLRLP